MGFHHLLMALVVGPHQWEGLDLLCVHVVQYVSLLSWLLCNRQYLFSPAGLHYFKWNQAFWTRQKKKKENSIKLNEFSETSLHLINFPSPDLENAILNLTRLSLIFQERVNPGGALRSGCLSDSVRQSGWCVSWLGPRWNRDEIWTETAGYLLSL